MDSEKSMNSFKTEVRIGHLIIFGTIFFLKQFVNFSALLLLKMNVLDIFNIIDLLTIFVISRGTKILIESNWLGVYVSRILNVHNRQINMLIWNEKLTFLAAAALFFKLTLWRSTNQVKDIRMAPKLSQSAESLIQSEFQYFAI